jgi:hypothetical protein
MDILFDKDDRMWVERHSNDRWRVYEVYDAEGRLIGELSTPVANRPRLEPDGPASAVRHDPRFAGRDGRDSVR